MRRLQVIVARGVYFPLLTLLLDSKPPPHHSPGFSFHWLCPSPASLAATPSKILR